MEATLGEDATRDIKNLASPLFGGKANGHIGRAQTLDFSGIT
jgi:hypothetical protein